MKLYKTQINDGSILLFIQLQLQIYLEYAKFIDF